MDKKDKILGQISYSIRQEDSNAEIFLFGSRARGDNTDFSDWDILVLIDDKNTLNWEERFRNHLYEIELETGEIISPIVYSKEYWNSFMKYSPLFINVNNEGLRI